VRNIVRSQFFSIAGLLSLLFVSSSCLCPLIVPDPPPKEEAWPSWAPDSQRLAYECYLDGPVQEGSRSIVDWGEPEGVFQSFYTAEAADICISDVDEHDQVRLITDPGGDWHPVWSPDGSRIAYLRQDGIYLVTVEGGEQHRLVPLDSSYIKLGWLPGEDLDLSWSPAGDRLLFSGCLDNPDHDVYVVDADTGAIVNLTPNSRMQEISPMWTLDGTKIVFLSTASSSSQYNSCDLKGDAPHQLRLVNVDGSGANVVYEPEFFYASISVSNSGQVLFVANMTSMTAYDYSLPSTEKGNLYRIDLAGENLIEMLTVGEGGNEIIIAPSWSPNEDYVAYRHFTKLRILNVGTGEVHELSEQPSVDSFVWSPDSQRIAVTTSIWEDMARDSEEHIHVFDLRSWTFSPLLPK